MRMVQGFEAGILGILAGAAGSMGRRRVETQVHVVRETNRSSLDRLIAALRRERDRADKAEAEVVELRARLAAANRATLAILQSHRP